MQKKTRYFVIGAGAVLVVGLGGGLVAYLAYNRAAGVPAGMPAELRYVPANAAVVAYADVRTVMNSDVRRAVMPNVDSESGKGRQTFNDFAGVDLEKQVNRVVAYIESDASADPAVQSTRDVPRALVLMQGTFDVSRIESAILQHGGIMEDHKGRKIFVRGDRGPNVAIGIVAADLVAMGHADIVRSIIDLSLNPSLLSRNVTANPDMMTLIRDNAGSTAWVVGQFDEISRRMRIPTGVTGQVPALRLVSIKADINGGVKATVRAEAGDKAAAEQLRDVVRGFVSMARLQSGNRKELEGLLKSVELSANDATVRMSFAVSPETLSLITPRPGARNHMTPPDPEPAR